MSHSGLFLMVIDLDIDIEDSGVELRCGRGSRQWVDRDENDRHSRRQKRLSDTRTTPLSGPTEVQTSGSRIGPETLLTRKTYWQPNYLHFSCPSSIISQYPLENPVKWVERVEIITGDVDTNDSSGEIVSGEETRGLSIDDSGWRTPSWSLSYTLRRLTSRISQIWLPGMTDLTLWTKKWLIDTIESV